MQVKIHETYRMIVAVADTGLIGKRLEEGIKQIEVREGFFRGDEKNFEEVVEILKGFDKEDAIFNLIGEESVNAGIKAGIVCEVGIIEIDGVKVALGLL